MKCTSQNQNYMSVKTALAEAWKTIQHANADYNDKIELFYRITPYDEGKNKFNDVYGGYISWKLASKYSARSQFYNPEPCGSCWHGSPPDKHFLETILKESVEVRHKMTNAVHLARGKNDYASELDAYRASDEVNEIDAIFFEK
jgi:hypothetical protein